MSKNIPTNAAKAVIKDSEGKILFLQRNPAKGASPIWDLPGGLIEPGEVASEALVREIEEELSVKAEVVKKIGEWTFLRPLDNKTVHATTFEVSIDTHDLQLSDEHIGAQWVSLAHVQKLPVKDPSIFQALGN